MRDASDANTPGRNRTTGRHGEPTYRLILEADSTVRLPKDAAPLELEFLDDLKFRATSLYRTDERGTIFPGPLRFELLLRAPDIERAETMALDQADVLCSIFALLGRGPIQRPRLHIAYEVREGSHQREFRQYFHDDLGLRTTRKVQGDQVATLAEALSRVDNDKRFRFIRALAHHRLALLNDDLLQRFLELMTGLEALNPPLGEYLSRPLNRVQECQNCGHDLTLPYAGGMYGWLQHECGQEVSRKAGRIRNGYVHGFKDLDNLRTESADVLPCVESALVSAVATLLGTDSESVAETALAARLPYQVALLGFVEGPVEEKVGEGAMHPHFDGAVRLSGSRNVGPEQEQVEVTLTLEATAQLPPSIQLNIDTFRNPRDATAENTNPEEELT